MKELFRTNDPVVISFAEGILKGIDIFPMVLDMNASILEGSIGILPRRIAVVNDNYEEAKSALIDAGLGHEFKS